MTSAAGSTGTGPVAARMGLAPGQVIQELGWDEDVDDELRVGVEDAIDGELSKRPWRPSTWCCCGGAATTAIWSTVWSTG